MDLPAASKTRIDLIALLLILSVAAVIAYGYFYRVDVPHVEARMELHNQIIAGTAPSPYRYRVLVPFAAEACSQALAVAMPEKKAFLLAYAAFDVLAVFLLLAMLSLWSRQWFSREQALIGSLFVAATMPIALQDHYFQPWSLLEAVLFTAALPAIYHRRYGLLAGVVVLASLNRETAIFIPLAFLFTSLDVMRSWKSTRRIDWQPIRMFCGMVLLWGIVFLGLRYFRGSAVHVETIAGLLVRNTTVESLFRTLVHGSLFLGAFWLFALLGIRHAPRFLRQVSWIIPLYLVSVLLWGVWYEVRLLLPLYPILVPLGLAFLFRQRTDPMPVTPAAMKAPVE
jgi:hypothetical protein